jgi:transposase-like protein
MKREELEKLEKPELIEIIMALIERVEKLESRLKMNSTNSSKPPSSDSWTRPKFQMRKSGKEVGGQKGHVGHGLKIIREPDVVLELKPSECTNCNGKLSNVEGLVSDVRYKIDVAIKSTIIKYKQIKAVCPTCSTVNKGKFPETLNSRIQYVESVRAIGALFTNYAMIGYDKTQKIMNDVFGVPIKAGTIVKHTKEFAEKCKPILNEISEKLKNSSILNCDETSVRVNSKKQWLHTASNNYATYNTVNEKRGKDGTDDNGILKDFQGTVVHDCWITYFSYKNCSHALCNAHLLRELQGVIDNTQQDWARQMQKLIREMKNVVDRYKETCKTGLSYYYNKKFALEYDRILTLGLTENPLTEVKKKRGKPRCLLDRFIKYQTEICRFINDFNVPFDNNQAERDIRHTKVKQKSSGGFRSTSGAQNFAKISSIIGTAIKQKLSLFKVFSDIISSEVNSIFIPNIA